MDCSNPVKDATRRTIASMLDGETVRARQNFAYLQDILAGAERTLFPALPERNLSEDEYKREMAGVMELIAVEVSGKGEVEVDFLEQLPPVPVCGLEYLGQPIHPPGVNQQKGNVSVRKVYGGVARDQNVIRKVLRVVEPEEVVSALKSSVYTRGTPEGLSTRLREQMTRKCVSVKKLGTGKSMATIEKELEDMFPIKSHLLPKWDEDLVDLILDLKTSSISSAGAPYWRPKPEALHPMLNAVLPLIYEAISEGRMTELHREQPELFLCEVKNKLDRYDPEKLKDKCRPYTALPFHFQALFSVLSQGFSAAMEIVGEEGGSSSCVNAYGFTMTSGGGARLMGRAAVLQDVMKGGNMMYYVYGDDADLWWNAGGEVWRVSPDFRQMDGSVDYDCMKATIQYVLKCFTKVWGENPFWEEVAQWWLHFASRPAFLLEGEAVYRKKQNDGLMTGVVGTTLFDTVKAALVYREFVSQVRDYKRYELLEEKFAVPWFKAQGLEVKEGTWSPQRVLVKPTPGTLISENKFLGVQMSWAQGPEEAQPVPSLPFDDWLKLLLVPRDDPADYVGKKQIFGHSHLGYQRKWFDRLRGLLVTGAFSCRRAVELIGYLLNQIDPVAVVMSVQANGGKGEPPELMTVTDEVVYPDSSGVPNRMWCENLYFSDGPSGEWSGDRAALAPGCSFNQWCKYEDKAFRCRKAPDMCPRCKSKKVGAKWLRLFPTVEDKLSQYRSKAKMRPTLKPGVAFTLFRERAVGPMEVLFTTQVPVDVCDEPLWAQEGMSKAEYEEMMAQNRLENEDREEVREKVRWPKKKGLPDKEIMPGMVKKREKPQEVTGKPHRKESRKIKVVNGQIVELPRKKAPTIVDQLAKLFETEEFPVQLIEDLKLDSQNRILQESEYSTATKMVLEGTKVLWVSDICSELGQSPNRVVKECRAAGLYVLGGGKNKIVMKEPPAVIPGTVVAKQLKEQQEENEKKADKMDNVIYTDPKEKVRKEVLSSVVKRSRETPVENVIPSKLVKTYGEVAKAPPLSKTPPPQRKGKSPKEELREYRRPQAQLVKPKGQQVKLQLRLPKVGWNQQKEHIVGYVSRVFGWSGYKLTWVNTVDEQKRIVTTRVAVSPLSKAFNLESGVLAEARGPSKRDNLDVLHGVLYKMIQDTKNVVETPSEGKQGKSWAEEVEAAEAHSKDAARLVDAVGDTVLWLSPGSRSQWMFGDSGKEARMVEKLTAAGFQVSRDASGELMLAFDSGILVSRTGTKTQILEKVLRKAPGLKLEIPAKTNVSPKLL